MSTCNLTTLTNQACANGFDTLSQTDKVLTRAVKLQLLCNISAGSGGLGSANSPVIYTNNPNTEALTPTNTALPALAYSSNGAGPIYGWDTVGQTWV